MESQMLLPFLPMPGHIHDRVSYKKHEVEIVKITRTMYVVDCPRFGRLWFDRHRGHLTRSKSYELTHRLRQLWLQVRPLQGWRESVMQQGK